MKDYGKIKLAVSSTSEGTKMYPAKVDLTLKEFIDSHDSYDKVKCTSYSPDFEMFTTSDCWIIKGHAFFRLIFDNGFDIDTYVCDGKNSRQILDRLESLPEDGLASTKEWIKKIK